MKPASSAAVCPNRNLAHRLAVETAAAGRVEWVVFLALCGEGRVECFWPVPLELPVEAITSAAVQLRLITDDGSTGWLVCTTCHGELTRGGYLVRFARIPEGIVLSWRAQSSSPPLLSLQR